MAGYFTGGIVLLKGDGYRTDVGKAIERLEILGYTLNRVSDELKVSDESMDFEDLNYSDEEITRLNSDILSDYLNAFQELIKNKVSLNSSSKESCSLNLSELAQHLLGSGGWQFSFPVQDTRSYLRLVLEAFPKKALIIQDITEITNAGYYKPEDEVRNIEIKSLTEGIEVNSKIIILTEGSSDSNILKRSMNLLFPHLSDYYSFIDFGISNLSGSASSLISQIKGFVGAGIKNRVVAILDNDTAAYDAIRGLAKTNIPSNIRVLHYPHLSLVENYPTLGPTGCQCIDVNGLAGSIELYLGKDVLEEDNELTPIQWKGFNDSIKKYQGEVMNKTKIQEKFDSKLKRCEKDNSLICEYDWTGIKLILNEIFGAFKT
jgi:hypothetical protein